MKRLLGIVLALNSEKIRLTRKKPVEKIKEKVVDVKSSATYLRLFLCFRTCDWKKSTRVFNDLVWTYLVWNITQERKTAFDRFKKAVRQAFLNKLRRTAEYAHIKIKTLSKLLRYHIINEWKRFFAACSAFRGASLSSFGIFDLGRSRKKAFCTFDYWELSKFFFNEFPETNMVLFVYYQCDLLMESLMQTFFRCEIAWISITEIAT